MTQFVLDTNVLLYDPNALYAFEQDTVVIPLVVVEDIGRMKKDPSETGRNARESSRILDELRQAGSLTEGVALQHGGRLRVRMGNEDTLRRLPRDFREQGRDSLLLATVLDIQRSGESPRTVLVSKDLNLRIKADALGIEVMDFEAERVDIHELYTGIVEYPASVEVLDKFRENGGVSLPLELMPNQYVVMRSSEGDGRSEYGR